MLEPTAAPDSAALWDLAQFRRVRVGITWILAGPTLLLGAIFGAMIWSSTAPGEFDRAWLWATVFALISLIVETNGCRLVTSRLPDGACDRQLRRLARSGLWLIPLSVLTVVLTWWAGFAVLHVLCGAFLVLLLWASVLLAYLDQVARVQAPRRRAVAFASTVTLVLGGNVFALSVIWLCPVYSIVASIDTWFDTLWRSLLVLILLAALLATRLLYRCARTLDALAAASPGIGGKSVSA